MGNVGLSSPWVRYAKRAEALFENDPDVVVDFDNSNRRLTVLVNGGDKANAIESLMPSEMECGNVTLEIEVCPSNEEATEVDAFRRAFAGNTAFVDVAEGYGPARDVNYALFMPDVVQVEEDDISEFDGLSTLTYAQLAKSVLRDTDTLVSTAVEYD